MHMLCRNRGLYVKRLPRTLPGVCFSYITDCYSLSRRTQPHRARRENPGRPVFLIAKLRQKLPSAKQNTSHAL